MHGGGLSSRAGLPFGTWHTRFMEWLTAVGFVGTGKGVPTQAARDVAAFAAAAGGC